MTISPRFLMAFFLVFIALSVALLLRQAAGDFTLLIVVVVALVLAFFYSLSTRV